MPMTDKPVGDAAARGETPLITRLRQHALSDPHDEREVLHAPLLREAADRIEQLERDLAEARERIEIYTMVCNTGGADELHARVEAAEREASELRADAERWKRLIAMKGNVEFAHYIRLALPEHAPLSVRSIALRELPYVELLSPPETQNKEKL